MTADEQSLIVGKHRLTAEEHSIRPSEATASVCDTDGHCVTCSDEALLARVLHADLAAGLALVDINGATAEVDVTLVDEVRTGELLLVHGGVAIARLEEP